jgi:transposase-like protein
MIKRIFKTTEGQSISIDFIEEEPCRHDHVEYLKIESLGGAPVWLCSKCGRKFNEKEFLELQQAHPN